MNVIPLYDRVIVKRLEENAEIGRIVIPDIAKEKPQGGEVVAVGHGKLENGIRVALEVKVGDRVLFSKYSGSEIKVDGQDYLIMREDDILGILAGAYKN